jgi:hypothetical protein
MGAVVAYTACKKIRKIGEPKQTTPQKSSSAPNQDPKKFTSSNQIDTVPIPAIIVRKEKHNDTKHF